MIPGATLLAAFLVQIFDGVRPLRLSPRGDGFSFFPTPTHDVSASVQDMRELWFRPVRVT